MIKYWVGHGIWMASAARSHRRLRRALRDPRRAQLALLDRYLGANADTEFGRAHRYRKIRTLQEYRDAVPVRGYDEFEPWIERIRDGRPRVLTAEPVLMMEKTGGSSGPAKYIPYTETLRREFRAAVDAWFFDLFTNRPRLWGGAQYWSISPVARERETTRGGLPVGFETDAEYLGGLARRVASWVTAVPAGVCRIPTIEANRHATIAHLIRCRRLRFISVWNPSFLTLLMEQLPAGRRPAELWPELELISCWDGGASRRFIPEVERMFPGVAIQGKGLLATEGVASIPLCGAPAPAPALASHLIEFLDAGGRPRLADEIAVGETYSIVLSTGGGLARYSLGDLVRVEAPGAIRFVGRAASTSDLCGEKLTDEFVSGILDRVCRKLNVSGFALIAPEWARPPRYSLFVESGPPDEIARLVEDSLRASAQYDYCRRLGQLGPLRGVAVPQGARRYLKACEGLGQRVGDIKPASLRREFGWRRRLQEVHVDG